MGRIVNFLNSRWLIAIVTGLFLFGVVMRFRSRV